MESYFFGTYVDLCSVSLPLLVFESHLDPRQPLRGTGTQHGQRECAACAAVCVYLVVSMSMETFAAVEHGRLLLLLCTAASYSILLLLHTTAVCALRAVHGTRLQRQEYIHSPQQDDVGSQKIGYLHHIRRRGLCRYIHICMYIYILHKTQT